MNEPTILLCPIVRCIPASFFAVVLDFTSMINAVNDHSLISIYLPCIYKLDKI
jgi:hypothetical protein